MVFFKSSIFISGKKSMKIGRGFFGLNKVRADREETANTAGPLMPLWVNKNGPGGEFGLEQSALIVALTNDIPASVPIHASFKTNECKLGANLVIVWPSASAKV